MRIDRKLPRRARLEPAHHERLGGYEARLKTRRQHFEQTRVQRMGEPIGYRPVTRHVDADAARILVGDELPERLPLRLEVTARPGRLVGATERITIDRESLHCAVGLAMKHQHGGAPRSKGRLRHEREVGRVFGILAIEDEPHVQIGLGHQSRQQLLEPFAQQPILRLDALARWQHVPIFERSQRAALFELH